VADYLRTRLDPTGDGVVVTRLLGPAVTKLGFTTPWRVVLAGETEGRGPAVGDDGRRRRLRRDFRAGGALNGSVIDGASPKA
jgi:hypothetical protein